MDTRGQAVEDYDVLVHKAARPMKVVSDQDGAKWICDKSVDENKNLEAQGCWRCGDLAFTRND
jgi:streptogramin lyase